MKRDDWPPRVRVTKQRPNTASEVLTCAFGGSWRWECQGCRQPWGERLGGRAFTLRAAWTAADDHTHSMSHNYRMRWFTSMPI